MVAYGGSVQEGLVRVPGVRFAGEERDKGIFAKNTECREKVARGLTRGGNERSSFFIRRSFRCFPHVPTKRTRLKLPFAF